MRSKRIMSGAAVLAAVAGGGFAAGRGVHNAVLPAGAVAAESAVARPRDGALPSFADLAARVSPAVVNIRVASVSRTDFPDQLFGENFRFPASAFPCLRSRSSGPRAPGRALSYGKTG